jgi:hypothetical protein
MAINQKWFKHVLERWNLLFLKYKQRFLSIQLGKKVAFRTSLRASPGRNACPRYFDPKSGHKVTSYVSSTPLSRAINSPLPTDRLAAGWNIFTSPATLPEFIPQKNKESSNPRTVNEQAETLSESRRLNSRQPVLTGFDWKGESLAQGEICPAGRVVR